MTSSLLNFLKTNNFNEDWFDKDLFQKDPFDYISIFELKVIATGKAISEYFTLLLLSGDYSIITTDKVKETKKEIEGYLLSISNEIDKIRDIEGKTEYGEPFSEFSVYFEKIYSEKLIEVFNTFIYQNFFNFIVDISVQFDFQNKIKLLSKNHIEIPELEDQSYKHGLRAYLIALKISRLEHFEYRYTTETIQLVNSLFYETHELENIYRNEVFKFLFVKIEFIFKKFLYRNKLEKRANRDVQFFIDLRSDEEISLENFSKNENFGTWGEKLENHYEINDSWRKRMKTEENSIFRLNKIDLNHQEFHVLTKCYKDISRISGRLLTLHSDFQRAYEGFYSSRFDEYAYKVADGYIFNNYLSCYLETEDYSLDLIKQFNRKLSEKQDVSNILNFFPWMVLSKRLISRLEELSKELFNEAKYVEFAESIKILDGVILKLEKAFEWSSHKNYMPFQFVYEFCLSDYQFKNKFLDREQQLFFFTSYFLPSNYSHFAEEKNEMKNKKLKLEALKEFYDSIQSIVMEVKVNSDKVNNSERRSIETLAIFSAVALFSIGSIQIFSFKTVALDPLLFYNFVLSFGYSLGVFVLLIWMITRQSNRRLSLYHLVVLVIFIVCSFFVVSYFVKGVRDIPNVENTNMK